MSQDLRDLERKLTPQALDAERSVLGCLLLDKDSLIKIADMLHVDDFYHDHHKFIYQSALDLFHASEPIDLVTVATKLQGKEQLELIGGAEYLAELQNLVPIASHIYQYAEIVKHRSTLRGLIHAGNKVTGLGYETDKEVEELLELAEKEVFSISQTFLKDKFEHIQPILKSSYEKFEAIVEDPDIIKRERVACGLSKIDEMLNGGFNKSDLVIIAARPSMGKTALTLSIAQNMAVKNKKKVGIISLEMSKNQMVERMFCSQMGVEAWRLHKGEMRDEDFEKIGPAMDVLGSAPIFIDDSMGGSVVELRAKTRRLQMEHGLDILMIDYLQLMSGKNPMNRVQEIAEISRSLKQLARELHIPVIALSQLSRTVESRPDKRPIMSDLRDSGSIEQDADVIAMLYREEYYNPDCEEDLKNVLEVNVIKHRNGGLGRVPLDFDRSRQRITDLDRPGQVGF